MARTRRPDVAASLRGRVRRRRVARTQASFDLELDLGARFEAGPTIARARRSAVESISALSGTRRAARARSVERLTARRRSGYDAAMDRSARLREQIDAATTPAARQACITELADGHDLTPALHGMLHRLLSLRLLAADQPQDALVQLRHAAAHRRLSPGPCALLETLYSEAHLCLRLGRSDEALHALRDALTREGPLSFAAVRLLSEIAEIQRDAGDLAGADLSHARSRARLLRWHWHQRYLNTTPEWVMRMHWGFPYGHAAYLLAGNGLRRVWMPGCGVALDPYLYRSLGFHVWASDISPAAIDVLLACEPHPGLPAALERTLAHWDEHDPVDRFAGPGSLRLDAHDFCEPAPHGEFDAILNISAWEELAPDERRAAASVFFAALRPGGYAIFSTEDHVTDELEQPLLDAGFVIPYLAEDRLHRQELDTSGIRWEQTGARLWDRAKQRAGQKTLDRLARHHEARCKDAAARETARRAAPAKVAMFRFKTR